MQSTTDAASDRYRLRRACRTPTLSQRGLLLGVLTDVLCPQMAEEIKGADSVIPWCVVATSLLNGILGFGTLLAMLYVTVDIDAVLASPTGELGFPFMQVVLDSVGSHAGATVMISIVIVMFVFAVTAFLQTASRIVFAFGRDKGLPFWQAMAKVRRSSMFSGA